MRLLARREHSRAELTQKLAAHGDEEEIAALLRSLEQSGLLSDMRFAESFVRTHAARFGAVRLRYELRRKGVAQELIDGAMHTECSEDELARARDVWRRKFGAAPLNAREYARQARFLQSRGFSAELVRKILRLPEE